MTVKALAGGERNTPHRSPPVKSVTDVNSSGRIFRLSVLDKKKKMTSSLVIAVERKFITVWWRHQEGTMPSSPILWLIPSLEGSKWATYDYVITHHDDVIFFYLHEGKVGDGEAIGNRLYSLYAQREVCRQTLLLIQDDLTSEERNISFLEKQKKKKRKVRQRLVSYPNSILGKLANNSAFRVGKLKLRTSYLKEEIASQSS